MAVFVAALLAGGQAAAQAKLELAKKEVAPGAKVQVTFSAPATFESNAWVGIIPSEVAHGKEAVNDQHDLAYQYLQKRTSGVLTFTAPAKPGSYDVRMHDTDNNGAEVASATFTVGGGEGKVAAGPSLKLNKVAFTPGQQIRVTFATPAGYAQNAWVGIIPSNVAHGNEAVNDEHDLTYQHLNGRTSGTLTFSAPAKGKYDVRMHDTDNSGKEVASVTFEVK